MSKTSNMYILNIFLKYYCAVWVVRAQGCKRSNIRSEAREYNQEFDKRCGLRLESLEAKIGDV